VTPSELPLVISTRKIVPRFPEFIQMPQQTRVCGVDPPPSVRSRGPETPNRSGKISRPIDATDIHKICHRVIDVALKSPGSLVIWSMIAKQFHEDFQNVEGVNQKTAAGSVVLDRNTNGRKRWWLAGTKVTYHDWQEQKAQRARGKI
jgi:hypothetical protein